MDITLNTGVYSNLVASNATVNKTTDNSITSDDKAKVNNYPQSDTVEISEESRAAAKNVQSLDSLLKEYESALMDSMTTTHEELRAWAEKSGYQPGQVIGIDIMVDDTYVMKNSSASALFEANKNNSYLQELVDKLGLTSDQSRQMTELFFEQFHSLTKDTNELDYDMQVIVHEKITNSMADLYEQFTNKSTSNKPTDNNSIVPDNIAEVNSHPQAETAEINKESEAAAKNAQSLDSLLNEYETALMDSMTVKHAEVRAWAEKNNYQPGQVIGIDIMIDDTFVMRSRSASALFEANKNNSYLQELADKLGLTYDQNRQMTELFFEQFQSLTKGINELDYDMQVIVHEKILKSMADLYEQFTNKDKS